ncbi:MAG: hypothetical protein NWE96_07835 [Candidatus Bathyarchaeota archaeon]|nr:hypothetical protein [Candidatus Bathyarchaeota archaeon]
MERYVMATNHYVINHRLMLRIQKKGTLSCLICHKPILEGQRVAARKATALRHEECYQKSFF